MTTNRKPKRRSTLTSGERSYLSGIGGSRSSKLATARHPDSRHQTYRVATVTLPHVPGLDDGEDA